MDKKQSMKNIKEEIANLITDKLGVCTKELPEEILALISSRLPKEKIMKIFEESMDYCDGFNQALKEIKDLFKTLNQS